MNCKDFRELIDSYLSDELLTETNHDVLRHLEDCAGCRDVIEARRAVRRHLKTAVLAAPQYQAGRDFTEDLRRRLREEAYGERRTTGSFARFGIGARLAFASAGLLLAAVFGLFWLNSAAVEETAAERKPYQTAELPSGHLVNVAFGDHQHCAVEKGTGEPVRGTATPARYAEAERVAMPQIREVLAGAELRSAHTCEYRDRRFTHLIVEKDDRLVSVMLTEKADAEDLGRDIALYTSKRYRLARFDVRDTAVFVVSGLDEGTNARVAESLRRPLSRYLTPDKTFQTALLTFY